MSMQMMPPRETPEQRAARAIRDATRIASDPELPSFAEVIGRLVNISDIAEAKRRFAIQADFLRAVQFPQLTVSLRGNAMNGSLEEIEIPVDFKVGPQNIPGSIERTVSDLNAWESRVRPVEPNEAQKILDDRVAEAIAIRALFTTASTGPGSPPSHPVSVTSRKLGDELLVANGFFLSTQEHLGYSEFNGTLPVGRYSFGVFNGTRGVFHPVLVAVPLHASPFTVPLP